MKLVAKNIKQLDLCLKLLYTEGVNNLPIDLAEDKNGKISYSAILSIEEQKFNKIKEKYEILIA